MGLGQLLTLPYGLIILKLKHRELNGKATLCTMSESKAT